MTEENFEARTIKRIIKKRKHVTLTIQEKLDIIAQVEEGTCSRQAIAIKYGIGKSTVHDIHKRRDMIRTFAALHNSDDVKKRRRVDMKEAEVRTSDPELALKQETESSDEVVEGFDYQEITDQEYEIVYETSLTSANEEDATEKTKTDSTLSSKPKRKSKTLTFREKYEVIQQIENGAPVAYICESYGIGRTTVYDYMRRKNEIINFIEKSNDAERKTFKKSKFPEVEKAVLRWCALTESFTKQEFYDCAKSAFDDARQQYSTLSPTGFCGSWSWTKRFFHRHPDLKRKLVNALGAPLDPAELSMSHAEYLDGNDETHDLETFTTLKDNSGETGTKIKFLNLNEKLEMLNEIDNGAPVAQIAAKYDVSKLTVYEIFKRRLEIREMKLTKLNRQQKAKTPRYPELETELLDWCLQQKNFPLSNVLIADKALCLFDELMLTGIFNPSSSWAKKFVLRHPELCERQRIAAEEAAESQKDDESFQQEFIEEVEDDASDKFDSDNAMADYDEEYIVEELDQQHDEQLQIETVQVKPEVASPHPALKIFKQDDNNSMEIPDSIALKSLKILIKYSQQRGHDSILTQLVEYQSQLEDVTTR